MKKTLLFLSIFLPVICGYSQPAISWQKSFGGSLDDNAESIEQTADGGYIIAGGSYSKNGNVTGNHGGSDCWIGKLSNEGIIEWQKSLGGTLDEWANSIQQTTHGGYIIAGYASSNDGNVTGNHGGSDYWIVKLSNKGVVEWQKSLGGTNEEYAYSVQQTTDGGYIIAGESYSNDNDVTGNHGSYDFWIVKLTDTGIIDWQKSLGGALDEQASSIQQTTDGGYIVAGHSNSNNGNLTGNSGSADYWIVKLSNKGAVEWQKSLGGTHDEWASSIQQTADGGYIIAGQSYSNDKDVTSNYGGLDCWIVKIDDTGITEWQKSFGGTLDEWANSIRQTTDGGYIIAGHSYSNDGNLTGSNGDADCWIAKLTNTGIIEWQKSLGGTDYDQASSIKQTIDGGYIIGGYSNSNDNDVAENHGGADCWIVKLNSTLSTEESTIENWFSIYPNPANKEMHVNTKESTPGLPYTIYDQSGRSVMSGKLNEQNSIIGTDILSKGVYIFSVGDKIKTNRKIIKE